MEGVLGSKSVYYISDCKKSFPSFYYGRFWSCIRKNIEFCGSIQFLWHTPVKKTLRYNLA